MVKRTVEDIYTEYYLQQAGSGFSTIYSGPVYQKGYGIGSFLGGLFRTLLPLLKSGSSAVGSELLKTGANILTDITHMEDPQQAIKRRSKESINNLGSMFGTAMFGNGYNHTAAVKRRHSQTGCSRGKKPPVKRVKKERTKPKTKAKPKQKVNQKSKSQQKPNKRKKNCTKSEVFDIFS